MTETAMEREYAGEPPMIAFDGVSKIYHVGDREVRALHKASMHIRKSEFVSIAGPSGSGKSTMMNIIGCLDTADEGRYLLNGNPVESYTERELTRLRSREIGFIFQNFNLIGNLNAWENIELPLIYQRIPKQQRKELVEEALEKVGLENRRAHRPHELSGGQQQRVAVARAVVTRPSLLLADEPTGNLDSATGREIMKILNQLHRDGNTIVLITHDEKIASQAPRTVRLLDGKVLEV